MPKPHIGRIEVIQPNDNMMDCICICPRCGRHVLYGNMTMYNGIHACSECLGGLHHEVDNDKEHHYERYIEKANDGSYEPFRYKGD